MTETRVRVEQSNVGKIVGWGALALTTLAIVGGGITFAVGVNSRVSHVDEAVTKLESKIDALTLAFGALNLYVGDTLGHHRGEHGRIEGAADTLEGILRRLKPEGDD